MEETENYKAIKEGVKEAFIKLFQREFDHLGTDWLSDAVQKGVYEATIELNSNEEDDD